MKGKMRGLGTAQFPEAVRTSHLPPWRTKVMGMALESWQLAQLQRLERLDPERTERVLNTLWAAHPELFEDLAVAAVDQEMLTLERCSELLEVSVEEVELQLLEYRQRTSAGGCRIVHDEERGNVAKLAEA